MLTTRERLDAICVVLEASSVIPGTRVAAIIFLLFGTPIGRIVALQADAITSTLDGMAIKLGQQPAPVPEPLIPLFDEHPNSVGKRSMNKGSPWLFPSTKPGEHISAKYPLESTGDFRHPAASHPQHELAARGSRHSNGQGPPAIGLVHAE